ncbi:MAG: aldehyde dehydrogenase family protein, partial [Pyrinomonadaceae bacterium]
VLTDAAPNLNVSREEVFAPVVVDSYSDFAEVVRRANDSRYGLQSGVFTSDLRRINFA